MRAVPARLLAAILTLCLIAACSGRALAVSDDPEELLHRGLYSDVPSGAWYAQAAAWAKAQGVLEGTSKSTFSPEEPITRGAFLDALYLLAGAPAVVEGSRFSDVSAGRRDSAAIFWAAAAGVAVGVSPARFAPDEPLTRQQAALLLYRLAGLPGAPSGGDVFPDLVRAAPWAAEAAAWAAGSGLLQGVDRGRLAPDAPLTRAQAAVLLMRFSLLPAV